MPEIKERIGYTEEPAAACKDCVHYREVENKYVDRMWDHECHISPIIAILSVKPHARCDKFERA